VRRLTLGDVKGPAAYERARAAFRRRIIDLKKRRRVALGDRVSLVFENTETALSQVQEMVRAERIVEPDKIQFEIDVYNALIPGPGELSATLFIEITRAEDVRADLDRFMGLDRPGALFFDLPRTGRVEGLFEAGHSSEEKISAVHYVRFPFRPDQIEEFTRGAGPVVLALEHRDYRARTPLEPAVREALAEDLRSAD
jgi:hypothetical protein